eukprot:8247410-Karenia_brevis.AAC.1
MFGWGTCRLMCPAGAQPSHRPILMAEMHCWQFCGAQVQASWTSIFVTIVWMDVRCRNEFHQMCPAPMVQVGHMHMRLGTALSRALRLKMSLQVLGK